MQPVPPPQSRPPFLRRPLVLAAAAALAVGILALLVLRGERPLPAPPPGWEAVDHVADGDTLVLRGGVTVRLVQIDTPETFFRPECYGKEASAATKHLLPRGTLVRLQRDAGTESKDAFGRLLRYVVREDGLNVNLRLVADGAAAPYFFGGVLGAYATTLQRDAEAARAAGTGLWGACPGTRLAPLQGVSTGPPGR